MLKSNEDDVLDSDEENTYDGPISFVSKTSQEKMNHYVDLDEEKEVEEEEYVLNFDGELVALYSNNNQTKNFYKKANYCLWKFWCNK